MMTIKFLLLFVLVALLRMAIEEGLIQIHREMYGPEKEVCEKLKEDN